MSFTFTSSLFGEVEYSEQEVYQFAHGLPGFPDHRKFILLKVEDSPFTVMHSLEEDLYFFLIDPFSLFPDYEFTLPEYVIEQLAVEKREDVVCYSIAVLRDPLSDSTANLVAPGVLNVANRKGMQVVLENTRYSIRQPIFLPQEQNGHNEKKAAGSSLNQTASTGKGGR
jgi:flagellar assembly factor FliW